MKEKRKFRANKDSVWASLEKLTESLGKKPTIAQIQADLGGGASGTIIKYRDSYYEENGIGNAQQAPAVRKKVAKKKTPVKATAKATTAISEQETDDRLNSKMLKKVEQFAKACMDEVEKDYQDRIDALEKELASSERKLKLAKSRIEKMKQESKAV